VGTQQAKAGPNGSGVNRLDTDDILAPREALNGWSLRSLKVQLARRLCFNLPGERPDTVRRRIMVRMAAYGRRRAYALSTHDCDRVPPLRRDVPLRAG